MISFSTLGLQLELRDPEWRDSEVVSLNTRFSTMMNGDIRSRRTTPTTTRLVMSFMDVTRRKALEVRAFISATAGTKVRLNDFRGQSWMGFILTEPFQITTDGRGQGVDPRKESNAFQLDFEGIRL